MKLILTTEEAESIISDALFEKFNREFLVLITTGDDGQPEIVAHQEPKEGEK